METPYFAKVAVKLFKFTFQDVHSKPLYMSYHWDVVIWYLVWTSYAPQDQFFGIEDVTMKSNHHFRGVILQGLNPSKSTIEGNKAAFKADCRGLWLHFIDVTMGSFIIGICNLNFSNYQNNSKEYLLSPKAHSFLEAMITDSQDSTQGGNQTSQQQALELHILSD